MNREIKFRAFDVENKEMLEVDLLDFSVMAGYKNTPAVRVDMYSDYFDREEMILMQYTGLKDKNGVEIYEGDIFNLGDRNIIYIVEWIDTGLMGRQYNNQSCVGLNYWRNNIEVIGNIYENPELLKESEE